MRGHVGIVLFSLGSACEPSAHSTPDAGTVLVPKSSASLSATASTVAPGLLASAFVVPRPRAGRVNLVEHDLSPAGARWKGWSAEAPQDAKLTAIGNDEVLLETSGPSPFQLSVRASERDLDAIKMGARFVTGEQKVEITKDTPTRIDWVRTLGERQDYFFAMNRKVAGLVISCMVGGIAGASSDIQRDQVAEGCESVRKK